jgi:hypothetical protein
VSFAAITLCVASQRVFVALSVYFVIDSVRKLLVTPSCYSAKLVCPSRKPVRSFAAFLMTVLLLPGAHSDAYQTAGCAVKRVT